MKGGIKDNGKESQGREEEGRQETVSWLARQKRGRRVAPFSTYTFLLEPLSFPHDRAPAPLTRGDADHPTPEALAVRASTRRLRPLVLQ